MIIRKATINDRNQLYRLLTSFDEYCKRVNPPNLLAITEYKNKTATFKSVINEWTSNSEYILFVAEQNDELIGHICGKINENPFRKKDREGFIEEWFVMENYRSKGIGKKLYNNLVSEFNKARCTHLALRVFSANQDTINLYHKMGFLDLEIKMIKI